MSESVTTCDLPEPDEPYSMAELIEKLKNDPAFLKDFAVELGRAIKGDTVSRKWIEAFYEPSEDELKGLGVPEPQWGSASKCTDSGALLIAVARDILPGLH
jgi:hypothetical protein